MSTPILSCHITCHNREHQFGLDIYGCLTFLKVHFSASHTEASMLEKHGEPSSSQTHTQMDTHPCIHRGMKSVIHNNSAPPVRTLLPLGCEVEGRKKGQGLNTSSDRNNIPTNTYPLPFTHIDTHTLSVLFDCPCWIERLKNSNNNKT